jgi:hypothetical protein
MPSIAVSAVPDEYTGNNVTDFAYIFWHSEITNPNWQNGRVTCRGWIGVDTAFTAITGFASSAENFLEPHVFISPRDTFMNTLKATWGGGSDSMRSYVIGEHVLHTYGVKGHHPTLSFAVDGDMTPSSLFETVDTALRAGAVKTPSTQNMAIADYPRVGEVHGVDIYPKVHNVSLTACRGGGVLARLGAPNGSLGIDDLVPIPFQKSFHGTGIEENTAVRSKPMILEFGVPLSIQRWLAARDTASLARLLSNGMHPKAKIELVDSATGAVLAVLDSIEITTAHDTLHHDGMLNYIPNEDFVGFPVYVRARVTGDTSVAEWRVSSLVEYGWNPSDLGFA